MMNNLFFFDFFFNDAAALYYGCTVGFRGGGVGFDTFYTSFYSLNKYIISIFLYI